MNYKQRLFTVLLGLLFATVLTDQASALYDPGVGRFCSRDPIGYIKLPNLFLHAFGLSELDPSGHRPCTAMEEASVLPKCVQKCAEGGQTYNGGLYKCEAVGWLSQVIIYDCNCITSKGCTTAYLRPLWTKMHNLCDSIGRCEGNPRTATEWECKVYRGKETLWLSCKKRREVIQRCFSPTDKGWDGHVKAIKQAFEAAKTCGEKCAVCTEKLRKEPEDDGKE